MYIKAIKVPDEALSYITPNKPYKLLRRFYAGGSITDNDNETRVICFNQCAHLDGGNWIQVFYKRKNKWYPL